MSAKHRAGSSVTKGRKQETDEKKRQKKAPNNQTIKKTYLKSRNACKVTFRMPRAAVPDARRVFVAGEFNEWNVQANPMKRLKNGDFTAQIELVPGRDYQFRYHIDGKRWENDWQADRYVPNPFGDADNSVVQV